MKLLIITTLFTIMSCKNNASLVASPRINPEAPIPAVVVAKVPVCNPVATCEFQYFTPQKDVKYSVKVTNHSDGYIPQDSGYLAGSFQGRTYKGFCLEKDVFISTSKEYTCETQTLDQTLTRLKRLEMLDNIIYLMNQDYVNGTIKATAGEVQLAIWALLYGADADAKHGGITGDPSVVDKLVCDALENGEGYQSCQGDYQAIVVVCGDDVQMNVYPINSCDIKVLNLFDAEHQ